MRGMGGVGFGGVGLATELNSVLAVPALNYTLVSMDVLTERTLVYMCMSRRTPLTWCS